MKMLRLLALAGMLLTTLTATFVEPIDVAHAQYCVNLRQYCENHRCVNCGAGLKKQQSQGGEWFLCDPGGYVCFTSGPWVDTGPCDRCAQ